MATGSAHHVESKIVFNSCSTFNTNSRQRHRLTHQSRPKMMPKWCPSLPIVIPIWFPSSPNVIPASQQSDLNSKKQQRGLKFAPQIRWIYSYLTWISVDASISRDMHGWISMDSITRSSCLWTWASSDGIFIGGRFVTVLLYRLRQMFADSLNYS